MFSTEVDVPFVGVLKAQFMRGPSIAPDGMLVDMRLVPVV